MPRLAGVRRVLKPRTRFVALQERWDDHYAAALRARAPGRPADILVIGVYRDPAMMTSLADELARSVHRVRFRLGAMGSETGALRDRTVGTGLARGKFQNLNDLLEPGDEADWVLVVDDDVTVSPGFLDTFVALCRRFDFALAQPAQTRLSAANWLVAKRRSFSVARRTRFVEIGPVTAIRADAARLLIPFPDDLVFGWGLDFHWGHVMAEHGLRMGVVDLTPVRHVSRKVASTYSWDAAQAEGEQFLRTVGHVPPAAGMSAIRTYRWPFPRRHMRRRR